MQRTKKALIPVLRQISAGFPLGGLIQKSGKMLFCPFYHTVSDQPLPHIRHLYETRTVDAFEADLDFFLENFTPLSCRELLEVVSGSRELTAPHFFLSFDDGLSEVFHVITPILEKKQIPATIFLNSKFVDNKDLMFRYKASLIINALPSMTDQVTGAFAKILKCESGFSPIKNKILKLGYGDSAVIDQMARLSGIDFKDFLTTNKPYLTSDQLRSLGKSNLFTFAAHSSDHPLYSSLELKGQKQQTLDCLEWLNSQPLKTEKAFAFPFTDDGVKREFFHEMFQGGELDMSFGTAGLKEEEFGGRHIQRFAMEGTVLPAARLVKTEYLYYILKRMVGRHKTRR